MISLLWLWLGTSIISTIGLAMDFRVDYFGTVVCLWLATFTILVLEKQKVKK